MTDQEVNDICDIALEAISMAEQAQAENDMLQNKLTKAYERIALMSLNQAFAGL